MTTPSRAIKTFDNPSEALRSHIDDLNSRTDIPSVSEGNDLRIDKYDDKTCFSVFPLAEYAKKPHGEVTTNLSYTNQLLYKHIRTMDSATEPIDELHVLLTKATTASTKGFLTYHHQVVHDIWHIVYRMPHVDISYDHLSSYVVLSLKDNNRYKIFVKVDELARSRGRREPKASLRKGWAGNWEYIEDYQEVPLNDILKAPFIAKTLKTIGTEYEEVTIHEVQKQFNTIHEEVTANIFEGLAERFQLGRVEYDELMDELMKADVAYFDDCLDRLIDFCDETIKRIRRGEEEGEGDEDGEDEPPKKKMRC